MAEASALTAHRDERRRRWRPRRGASALERHGLTPANANGAGQTVAAGTMEQLQALAADPPAKARVIPLAVAGAFHTHHMAPAVDALRDAADEVTVQARGRPCCPTATAAPWRTAPTPSPGSSRR